MNQNSYPYMPFIPDYQNFNGYNNYDLLNRIEKLERDIKKLESRIYHLEKLKEKEDIPEDDGLYMV